MSTEFDKTFPNKVNTPIIMKIGFILFLEILGKCTFARKITKSLLINYQHNLDMKYFLK